ncbi:uncharacterized protein [Drosophila takahashii]|uniref:uncharacterized protein isoform X2 n=1 Tax=Drosophila takahashii TaxID=29030 RepID=UPI001CF86E3F|nr:uncharacterized protein LOC108066011 isoform X2 [Drosophila takahashii]
MAANESDKPKKRNEKHNELLCPIVYKNEIPGPEIDCKFMPCGKDILEYTVHPVSFPSLEYPFLHHFGGLETLFDLDLVDQRAYERDLCDGNSMDPDDAALLADIEALDCGYSKPRPSRARECSQMFAKERVQAPQPRSGLKRPVVEQVPKILEPISLQQQIELSGRTFEDIKKPFIRHSTKRGSNARPVEILPILPDTDLQNCNYVEMLFDIPPKDGKNLVKDCGSYLINFMFNRALQETNLEIYLSDQRYREQQSPENPERGDEIKLSYKGCALRYVRMDNPIKLRRERPRPQALANKCLLEVNRVEMEAM